MARTILFLPLEHKIHIFSPPCNILCFTRQHLGGPDWGRGRGVMAFVILAISWNFRLFICYQSILGEQGWRSAENARLPRMWLGFDSSWWIFFVGFHFVLRVFLWILQIPIRPGWMTRKKTVYADVASTINIVIYFYLCNFVDCNP